jgi:Uma2 family endonuclease
VTDAAAIRYMTADDLFRMPDDGMRHELVGGWLVSEPPTGGEHALTTTQMVVRLGSFVRERKLGRVYTTDPGFVLSRDPDTVRAPDVAFISNARLAVVGRPRGFIPGAPDLAVEILSPGDRPNDVEAKVADYLAAGASLVWVVDPIRRLVRVHRKLLSHRLLREEDWLEGEDVVPGFRIPVAELFE